MSNSVLSPQTDIDELRGSIRGHLSQVLESIDLAQSHYAVFKDLGITPDNAATPTAQKKMRLMYKTLALELHPDKVANKLKGGETEDQKETLRNTMEERFKKLQEALEVLTDEDKRNKYNNILKNRVSTHFHAPETNDLPTATQKTHLFQAMVGLDTIETAFNLFVKRQLGNEASAETNGYAARYLTHPKTGQPILELSFPDEKSAHRFIKQLLDQGMIRSPWQAMQQSNTEAKEPAKTETEERSHSPFQLPQLTPTTSY